MQHIWRALQRSVIYVDGTSVTCLTIYDLCNIYRAPRRLVVYVDGTSVVCPTIYATYTVVGWWYERRMLDNFRYIHGV